MDAGDLLWMCALRKGPWYATSSGYETMSWGDNCSMSIPNAEGGISDVDSTLGAALADCRGGARLHIGWGPMGRLFPHRTGMAGGVWGRPRGAVGVVVFGDGPRSAYSLQPQEMAFYISQPKVRQAGFELPAKTDEERQPSPAPAYDPSMYFAHNNFGSPFDAFNVRPKYGEHAPSVDFADTLASMISESEARNGTPTNGHHAYHPQPNPFDPHQFPHASSGHPILSPTGSAFSPGPHSHHGHHFPASAPATSHPSFFDSAAHDYPFLRGAPTDRADTPSLASPTTADSPFSQTAPPVATAPSKRGSGSAASRSRSRGPAAASTSRSRARKRPSVSSPSPPPSATSAVLIPSQNAWYIPTHGAHTDNGSFGFSLGSHGTPSSLSMAMPGQSPKSLGAKVAMAEDIASKQAQMLSEKRRRRRESHNAVERRRRDNINEKISELSTLIPECLLADAPVPATGKDDVLGAVDEEGGKEGPKANKGMILRKSVDYIKYLQQLVRAQASRNRELESQLSQYRGDDDSSDSCPNGLAGVGGIGAIGILDVGGLLTIPDEDGEDAEMNSSALDSELSSQILATIEAGQDRPAGSATVDSPSVDGMDEEDEDAGASVGDESERGRQALRRGRFGYPSQSVGKSAKVEEVDESALSDASGKMED